MQQLSAQQLQTLNYLGIPVWRLRQNPLPPITAESSIAPQQASAKIAVDQIQLNSDAALLVCCPVITSPAEQQLLININNAIAGAGLSFQEVDGAALETLSAEKQMSRQVFIFGEAPAGLHPYDRQHCYLLPSLSELLQLPNRKAEVWAAICQLLRSIP